MVCENCAQLADIQTGEGGRQPIAMPNNDHLNGGISGVGLKCLHPVSCSCQHKPVGRKYINRDDND